MLRSDIGVGTNALQCTTDTYSCCRNNIGVEMRGGNFFFPETGQVVPSIGEVTNGYYRNRLSRGIRLHRQPNGNITGQFKCTIPQAGSTSMANLFINIGEFIIIAVIFSHNYVAHKCMGIFYL